MKKTFEMEDLDCANCAAKMENEIKKIEGVKSAVVSFMAQKMIIEVEEADFEAIMKQVVKVCKKVDSDCTVII